METRLVRCTSCERIQTGGLSDDDTVRPIGIDRCPECSGSEFAPVSAETMGLDTAERADARPGSETD